MNFFIEKFFGRPPEDPEWNNNLLKFFVVLLLFIFLYCLTNKVLQ